MTALSAAFGAAGAAASRSRLLPTRLCATQRRSHNRACDLLKYGRSERFP